MSPRRRSRRDARDVEGVLVVDKPTGPTSFDIVRAFQRSTRAARLGHAGTLDPMATGLLVLCFGEATKAVPWIMDAPKSYVATIRLGVATDTYDAEGRVLAERPVPALDADALDAALAPFRGGYDQAPPAWSAIRKDGQRSHEIVRRGGEVVHEARPVALHALQVLSVTTPELVLELTCGKGFYVRSLAHDLGEALGCGAHLTALRRTATARFTEQDARPLDMLLDGDTWERALVALPAALDHLPAVTLDEADEASVRNGGPATGPEGLALEGFLRALDPGGRLVAVLRPDERRPGLWRPERVFH